MPDGFYGISSEALFINRFEVEYSRQYAAGAGQTTFSSDQAGDWLFQVPGFSTNSLSAWDISDPLAPVQIQNPQVTQDGSTDTLAFEQAASGSASTWHPTWPACWRRTAWRWSRAGLALT